MNKEIVKYGLEHALDLINGEFCAHYGKNVECDWCKPVEDALRELKNG